MLVFCQDKPLALSELTDEDEVVIGKRSDLRKTAFGRTFTEIVAQMTRLGAHGD